MDTNSTKQKSVYIGLGSNIDQPCLQIKKAIAALNNLPDTKVITDSGYYKSRPMGPEDQPDYMNAVVELETALDARQLLKQCQQIEQQQGRIKKRHWGERTIDLDILLYADMQLSTDELTLPHPGICERDFVYIPLLKLKPEVVIPGKGMLKALVESSVKSDVNSAAEVSSDFSCQFYGPISRE